MALAHSPSIITSGLILAVDAGNLKSYNVGISSTTWKNSVGPGIGTFVNMDGSNYDSSNGGSLVFNGVDECVGFGSNFYSFDLVDKTFQCWIKKTESSQKGIVDKEFDIGGSNYGGWGFWTQSNNKLWFWVQGNKDLFDNGPNAITLNSWTNVSVTYSTSSKTANFYINGVLNSTVSDATIVEKSSGSALLLIGALRNGFLNFEFDGNISNVLGYSRVLSASEIQQNFNATKSRYGL